MKTNATFCYNQKFRFFFEFKMLDKCRHVVGRGSFIKTKQKDIFVWWTLSVEWIKFLLNLYRIKNAFYRNLCVGDPHSIAEVKIHHLWIYVLSLIPMLLVRSPMIWLIGHCSHFGFDRSHGLELSVYQRHLTSQER